MDLGKIFKEAVDVFAKNAVVVIIGYLVVIILSIVTLGLLAPAMWTGYQLMLLKAKQGKKIEVNDVFGACSLWLRLLGQCIWIAIILMLLCCTIIGIIPAILMGVWWMYANLFVGDKKQTIGAAMLSSKTVVRKNNVWMHLLFVIIVSIISSLGSYVFVIGTLVTAPIAAAAMVCAYADETAGKKKKK